MSEQTPDATTDDAPDDGHRSITLTRTGFTEFDATNGRGGTIHISGEGPDFRPVELLLVAMAGCSAMDVDWMTSRNAEPLSFEVVGEGRKVRDDDGVHLTELEVTFKVAFPEGVGGDRARARMPNAIARSRDFLCTVSRTIQLGAPVTMRQG